MCLGKLFISVPEHYRWQLMFDGHVLKFLLGKNLDFSGA